MRSKLVRDRMVPVLLATTMFAAPGTAFAQQEPQASGDTADAEIIVTANRREENLQDVPISVTAIGEAKLDQAQVASFDDYAKLLPSVSFQSFGPSQSQIFFRGVASGGDGLHIGPLPTSSLYLDEIPVTTIFGSVDVHIYDIARVEALAGPQGTLFGASSLSGTLRIITNQPSTSGFSGNIDVQGNKFGKGDFGGSVESYINVPLSDRAALRVVGFYEKQGGYIDNIAQTRTFTLDDGDPTTNVVVNNSALVENDYNDVETYGGRAALKIDLDDSWTATPQLIYQHQVAHGGFLYDPRKGDLNVTDSLPSVNKDRWYQAALTIQGKISDWDLTYAGGYFSRKVNNRPDYSYYSVAYDSYTYVDDNGVTQFGYATYYPDGKGGFLDPTQNAILGDTYTKITNELRISSPSDRRMRLTAGLFMQRQTDAVRADYEVQGTGAADFSPWLSPFPGTDSVYTTRVKRIDRDYAAFAQGEFDLTDALTVIGGLRYYRYNNTIFGFSGPNTGSNLATCLTTTPYKTGPCVNVDKRSKDDGFIWKGSVKYQVTPDVMVYGTVSRGYRPGGNNRRPGVDPFKADTLDNYELGWKTRFSNVTFNGAVFYEKWKDLQYSLVPVGQNGQTNTYNAGDARIYGIEGEISARWGGLILSAGATYVDAQLTTDFCQVDPITKNIVCVPAQAPAAAKGTRLPVTPKFKGNATARYEFPLGASQGFVQGVVNHQGGTRSFLTDADFAAVGATRAFTTFDFSAGLHWDQFRLEAFIQNAFDKRGALSLNSVCVTQICGQYSRIYPVKPQLFGLKAGYDF
ncbi:TonB-dependent receptor [Novosphingobium tardum]|uniref:TonB-dependent receptor n=1 Tax=Novosphingobium tardum TaxID=1538021 RepID=A0ABV8RNA4_9SPHN